MDSLKHLRMVALIEGVSFALLMTVGMPLKYLLGIKLATRILGSVHGILTLWFVSALFRASVENKWPAKRWGMALLASVIPFGAFVFDRTLRQELLQLTQRSN